MKIIRVAESLLSISDDESCEAITLTGYVKHPWGKPERVQNIDELHEAAGRGCYESYGRPNPKTATNEGYLGHIVDVGHFSVLEHGCVTYWIDGVSRNLLLELERHRHFSYSVISTRYVDMSEKPFVMPKAFALLPEVDREILEKRFTMAHNRSILDYREAYQTLIDHGFKKKEAREAARDILPGGIATTLYLTGNIRAYREMIGKRNAPGAAADIQEFAQLILADLRKVAPNSVQDME